MTRGMNVILLERIKSQPGSGGLLAGFISLRGETDHRTQNAARQHDFEVMLLAGGVGHGGHQERQEHADPQTKQNAQRQRADLFRKISYADTGYQPLDRGTNDDADDLGPDLRIKPCRQPIEYSEESSQ